MKWSTFIVLGAVTLICQTTIAHVITIYSIRPNWMFVLAVHYALWGPWPEAAIGAWFLGLAVDVQTMSAGGRIGLYAFSFGAAAWLIIRIRAVFWREHPLTQLSLTFVFALAIEMAADLYRHRVDLGATPTSSLFWPTFFAAVYTAAFTPYMHWALIRLWRWTGLRPPASLRAKRRSGL